MKTLYVSDLDGTLLDGNSQIPELVLKELNRLIQEGLLFTVATGRSYTSVTPVIQGLNLKLPAILLNGVHLFEMCIRDRSFTFSVSITICVIVKSMVTSEKSI